jgi:hypothetical protein
MSAPILPMAAMVYARQLIDEIRGRLAQGGAA